MNEKRPVGRPRKEKVSELEEMEAPQAAVSEETVNNPNTAIGIYQGIDKQWYIAVLRFNPETGRAVVTERFHAGEDKNFANEAFKIKTMELDIL